MTHRDRAVATLKLLLCSDAEPSPSAVAVLTQAFEECANVARDTALNESEEWFFGAGPKLTLIKEDA